MNDNISEEEIQNVRRATRIALSLSEDADLSYIDADLLSNSPQNLSEPNDIQVIYGHNVRTGFVEGQACWIVSSDPNGQRGCANLHTFTLLWINWLSKNDGWCVVGKDGKYRFDRRH